MSEHVKQKVDNLELKGLRLQPHVVQGPSSLDNGCCFYAVLSRDIYFGVCLKSFFVFEVKFPEAAQSTRLTPHFASIASFLLNELYLNTCFQSWSITLSFASLMASFSSWLFSFVHPNKVSLCIFRGLQGFCMASPSCTLKFSKTKNVTFLCRPL